MALPSHNSGHNQPNQAGNAQKVCPLNERDLQLRIANEIKKLFPLLGSMLFILFLLDYSNFTGSQIYHKIIIPCARLLAVISVTLFISSVIEARGWSKAVAGFFMPALRLGRLNERTVSAFVTAFFSGVAANTILAEAYQDGKISKKELFIANVMNLGLPGYTLHLPTAMAIIMPMVGRAGLIYLGLTFLAAFIRTSVALATARFMNDCPASLSCETDNKGDITPELPKKDGKTGNTSKDLTLKEIFIKHVTKRMWRIAVYTIPIFTLVAVMQQKGFFEWLRHKATGLLPFGSTFLPVEAVSVVVFSIASEFTAGAAAAGAMLQSGILTETQIVIALLMGNVLATPIRALRHQLPSYLGIFNPVIGAQVLTVGQSVRVLSVLIVAVGYYFLVI